jgi:hypothetical protein
VNADHGTLASSMNGRRLGISTAATAIALLVAPSVGANGRFPEAAQLVVDPRDPAHIVVRTTFGPIQSVDSGRTWRWACEKSVGYYGVFDPALAIAEGGVLFGLYDGLARSADRLCGFERSAGALDTLYVADLAVDSRDAKHVIAVSSPTTFGTPGVRAVFAESIDGGRTFAIPGDKLPEDFVPYTTELAPSRPKRIYVSGKGAFPLFGVMERSDDGGLTWTETTFDLAGARAPYIAAVDPTNDARVFLRLDGEPNDRLALSGDGARTFDDVFVGKGKLLGFALSPDGTRVAVGGPADGIHVADAHTLVFVKTSDVGVRCLTWTTAGLYACASEARDAFTVGLTNDEGKSFATLYRNVDLAPLACSAGTSTGDTCAGFWPGVRASLGVDDAGPTDATSDGTSDAAGDPTSDAGPLGGLASDVGCTAASRSVGGCLTPAFAALLAALAAKRRRARRRSFEPSRARANPIRAR